VVINHLAKSLLLDVMYTLIQRSCTLLVRREDVAVSARERFRETEVYTSKGIAYYSNTGIPIAGSGGMTNNTSTWVEDWVRPKGDPKVYPLHIEKYVKTGGLLNKKGSGNQSVFKDFDPTVYDVHANFPHLTSLDGNLSDAAAAVQGAARTNPSRAYVDVPVTVLELGDIAQLLRDTGRKWYRKAAHANISYQFGIAPLVDDLFKLFDFIRHLEQRMKEIERLKSKRGLRRTKDLGEFSRRSFDSKTIQSQGVLYTGTFSIITRQSLRVHCRWFPTHDFKKLGRRSSEWLVKRALHGLTFDSSTAWEALPWTWLIDYCTDIGAYFRANRNIIGASLQDGRVWIIRHTQTEYVHQGFSAADYTFAKAVVRRESKVRRSALVSPSAWLPFLSANQLGILLSLAILRLK
jgi:hypothetical protein